ncbi:hypothetical protein [Rossellomorea marisflavi]|uniref:hypothetical protein n=1 Tax=Rossellomorea marisflavi TaxID=189381 RepID=UPI003D2F383D
MTTIKLLNTFIRLPPYSFSIDHIISDSPFNNRLTVTKLVICVNYEHKEKSLLVVTQPIYDGVKSQEDFFENEKIRASLFILNKKLMSIYEKVQTEPTLPHPLPNVKTGWGLYPPNFEAITHAKLHSAAERNEPCLIPYQIKKGMGSLPSDL